MIKARNTADFLSVIISQPTATAGKNSIAYPFGNPDAAVTFYASELYGKNVALDYVPETEEDRKIIEQYGSIYETPAYLVRVVPQLLIDGVCVAEGQATSPGMYTIFTMDISEAACDTINVQNPLVAGGDYAVTFDYGNISEADLLSSQDKIAKLQSEIEEGNCDADKAKVELLSAIGTLYFCQEDIANDALSFMLDVSYGRQIGEAITGYMPQVSSMFGAPVAITEGSVYIDVDANTYGVAEKSGNTSADNEAAYDMKREFMLYSGIAGSYLESFVLEETTETLSVSTIKIFEVAISRGIELVKIDLENEEEIEKLDIDDKTRKEIRNAVNSGKTVIVPEKEICYYGWRDTGYMALDSETGAAAYMISGSLCGGSTAFYIVVGVLSFIIAVMDLHAAMLLFVTVALNPYVVWVAEILCFVSMLAIIESGLTLYLYCKTGEAMYGEQMMLDLYLNVTLASVTKALEPLMSSVTRRIIKGLENRGVSANYLSSLYGSLDGETSKIEYKPKVDVEPDIKPDFGGNSWDSKEVRDALKDTYGDDIADTLYEFGEDGVELAEKYGNELGDGLGGLDFNDGRKALNIIDEYGDDAIELLEGGKSVDEITGLLGCGSGSNPSSKILRENLINVGEVVPEYKNAAHHIVAGSASKAKEARTVLKKYEIDINSAENGVFLPTEKGVSDAAYHPSLHTNSYYDKVNALLREAESKEDVLDILQYIKEELIKGTF